MEGVHVICVRPGRALAPQITSNWNEVKFSMYVSNCPNSSVTVKEKKCSPGPKFLGSSVTSKSPTFEMYVHVAEELYIACMYVYITWSASYSIAYMTQVVQSQESTTKTQSHSELCKRYLLEPVQTPERVGTAALLETSL